MEVDIMNQYVTRTIIKELRERNKMTQLQLADKLGVTDKTISKWECGKGLPEVSLMLVKDTASDITTPRLYNIKSTPKLLISKIGACFHI